VDFFAGSIFSRADPVCQGGFGREAEPPGIGVALYGVGWLFSALDSHPSTKLDLVDSDIKVTTANGS